MSKAMSTLPCANNWESVRYLVYDVFERVGAVNCETNKEQIRLWVTERPQSIVFFLSRSIPKGQLHTLAIFGMGSNGYVILKNSRYVFLVIIRGYVFKQ
jgi:hypothetical protein